MHIRSYALIQHIAPMPTDSSLLHAWCKMSFAQVYNVSCIDTKGLHAHYNHFCIHYIGQVVAWCISDQETAEVITVLFNSLKQKSPDTQVTTIMTDDGNK